MGLLKGSASFVRFSVLGELPENTLDFIADRIIAFSFQDIDDTYDEYSIGWVSILNMFDSQFQYASYAAGDYITLTMRIDETEGLSGDTEESGSEGRGTGSAGQATAEIEQGHEG